MKNLQLEEGVLFSGKSPAMKKPANREKKTPPRQDGVGVRKKEGLGPLPSKGFSCPPWGVAKGQIATQEKKNLGGPWGGPDPPKEQNPRRKKITERGRGKKDAPDLKG